MKKIFLLAAIIYSSLHAQNSLINSYNPAVNNGENIWIEADILYWKPREKALVATNEKSDVFTTDNFTLAPVVHPHFDWSLGYRVDAGYLFSSNNWDVETSWTHFSTTACQHKSTHCSSFCGMFPIWAHCDVICGDYVFESKLKWKLTLNMLDLQFGRYLKWRRLEMKPFFGLRSAWVKQHGNVNYQGGIFLIGIINPGTSLYGTDHIKLKNNYWGLGPRVGIAPRLIVGKGFSLNGLAAISGLYGRFQTKQKETYLASTRFCDDDHFNRFRWIADFAAGGQWKYLFSDERYGITLKADWEYHIFSRQFELKDEFDLVPDNRDLKVQGVTFGARFDF